MGLEFPVQPARRAVQFRQVYEGKPIIGIAGGIGSGKSFIAGLFREEGCLVISSDDMVRQSYRDESVKRTLKQWWGTTVFDPTGEVDRSAVARKIFTHPSERQRLERLIHPIVNEKRERLMKSAAGDEKIRAFVWDTPLLFETGLNRHCDAVVYIEAPLEVRLRRVEGRGWDREELLRREKSQMPLDRKAEISDYSISNSADAESGQAIESLRIQVREVISRILDRVAAAPKGASFRAKPMA